MAEATIIQILDARDKRVKNNITFWKNINVPLFPLQ